MKRSTRALACTSLVAVLAVLVASAGCGGKQSMASKSAAAYAEAKKKGLPISGGEHEGHAATTADGEGHAAMEAMDHAAMEGVDHSKMAGMNHSKMPGIDHSKMAGMDHSKMPEMDHSKMAGMDHSKMTGMDHANMPGMQHGASSASVAVVTEAPRSSSEVARIVPGETLRSDPFDTPAPIAVAEAAKAAGHKKDQE